MVKRSINASLENLLRAWEELSADASFGGMTLEEFRTATAPVFTNRRRIAWLDQERASMMAARSAADRDGIGQYLLVVNSIKGSPAHGEDSPLYRSLGYKTRTERRSGLTRKPRTEPDTQEAA